MSMHCIAMCNVLVYIRRFLHSCANMIVIVILYISMYRLVIEYYCDFKSYVTLYRLCDHVYSPVCVCFSGLCMSMISDEYWMTRTSTCTMSYGSETDDCNRIRKNSLEVR